MWRSLRLGRRRHGFGQRVLRYGVVDDVLCHRVLRRGRQGLRRRGCHRFGRRRFGRGWRRFCCRRGDDGDFDRCRHLRGRLRFGEERQQHGQRRQLEQQTGDDGACKFFMIRRLVEPHRHGLFIPVSIQNGFGGVCNAGSRWGCLSPRPSFPRKRESVTPMAWGARDPRFRGDDGVGRSRSGGLV